MMEVDKHKFIYSILIKWWECKQGWNVKKKAEYLFLNVVGAHSQLIVFFLLTLLP